MLMSSPATSPCNSSHTPCPCQWDATLGHTGSNISIRSSLTTDSSTVLCPLSLTLLAQALDSTTRNYPQVLPCCSPDSILLPGTFLKSGHNLSQPCSQISWSSLCRKKKIQLLPVASKASHALAPIYRSRHHGEKQSQEPMWAKCFPRAS